MDEYVKRGAKDHEGDPGPTAEVDGRADSSEGAEASPAIVPGSEGKESASGRRVVVRRGVAEPQTPTQAAVTAPSAGAAPWLSADCTVPRAADVGTLTPPAGGLLRYDLGDPVGYALDHGRGQSVPPPGVRVGTMRVDALRGLIGRTIGDGESYVTWPGPGGAGQVSIYVGEPQVATDLMHRAYMLRFVVRVAGSGVPSVEEVLGIDVPFEVLYARTSEGGMLDELSDRIHAALSAFVSRHVVTSLASSLMSRIERSAHHMGVRPRA